MGRLTGRYYDVTNDIWHWSIKSNSTNDGLVATLQDILDKLAHYEDLEEQGRLIEQKYGQWSLLIDETFDCEYLTCSICGEDFFDGDNDTVDYVPNYCPHCGAKMELKELEGVKE